MNMLKDKKLIAGAIILPILLASGITYYLLSKRNAEVAGVDNNDQSLRVVENKASSTQNNVIPKARQLPPYQGESVLFLNPDPRFLASASQSFIDKYGESHLKKVGAIVIARPSSYNEWIDIAYTKKLFNNYNGARDALEYAKLVEQKNPLAYYNLGVLYGYELHDAKKAEDNFTTALRLNVKNFDYYISLANFYVDVIKSPQKAEAIYHNALEEIPSTEPNLYATIGAFYRDQNKPSDAIVYFEKASKVALTSAMRDALQAEITRLREKSNSP